MMNNHVLFETRLETPLGHMIAIANESKLLLLEFDDRQALSRQIRRLKEKTQSTTTSGKTKPIESIEKELRLYFQGSLKQFKTPVALHGTDFQQDVWRELIKIPAGETKSYADIACAIDKPTAFRAVARANSANQLAIVIPCHRVINTNGELGGYAGGLTRKKWLIQHEKRRSLL